MEVVPLVEGLRPFQSQTGSTGHSDKTECISTVADMYRFQSQTGSTGHSDKINDYTKRGQMSGFNPKRAPQAIPTIVSHAISPSHRSFSTPNEPHTPTT